MDLIKVLERQDGKPTCIGGLRGLAFSTSLKKYADENGYKILTRNPMHLKEFPNVYKYCNYDNLRGKIDKVYLIETDIHYAKLEDVIKEKVIGGFTSFPLELEQSIECPKEEQMSFNEKLVSNLKKEASNIMSKLTKVSEDNNFGTEKNLINILRNLADLINDYGWKFMYSEYTTTIEDKEVKQVAIWEQNSDGLIRNYKKWNVEINK